MSYTYTVAGQLLSITDARGTRTYGYDAKDRVAKVTEPDGTFVAYGYDANGNRTELSTPSGTSRYQYDANNRLAKVIGGEYEGRPVPGDAIHAIVANGLPQRWRPNRSPALVREHRDVDEPACARDDGQRVARAAREGSRTQRLDS